MFIKKRTKSSHGHDDPCIHEADNELMPGSYAEVSEKVDSLMDWAQKELTDLESVTQNPVNEIESETPLSPNQHKNDTNRSKSGTFEHRSTRASTPFEQSDRPIAISTPFLQIIEESEEDRSEEETGSQNKNAPIITKQGRQEQKKLKINTRLSSIPPGYPQTQQIF